MANLELRGISKSFGAQVAVRRFDLAVSNGELVSFLGPSGCGKTTTLRIAAGFELPTTGQVFVDGADVTSIAPNRRRMGMVFQGYALFPNMTAASNIEFGLAVRRRPADERRRRVSELLELFGLAHVAGSYPHQMSGGQQQRVALARALATQPSVLLLDEPLSAVDAKVREELRAEIRRMQAELGITTILVTHDQAEALSISDRVVVMNAGVIEEVGTPARVYWEPRSAFTASFIGAMNELPVRVVDNRTRAVERAGQRFAVGEIVEVTDGAAGVLLVRPELLEPTEGAAIATAGATGPTIRGRVRVQTFLGSTTRMLVDEQREDGAAPDASGSPLEGLAVDVPSGSAGQWPIGATVSLVLHAERARVVPTSRVGRASGAPAAPGAQASADTAAAR
jgi:putative spermidine/putrescine transport system ATP-binding protein